MFDHLTTARRALRHFSEELDPDAVSGVEAQAAIESLVRVEKLAAGARLRLIRRLEDDRATADWLARQTGQTPGEAAKDVAAARALEGLPATDAALRDGELSADQAREVTSGASADPSAEAELLDTARNASVQELRRKAKSARSAATDDAEKNRQAHRNRRISHDTDDETREGWLNMRGPLAVMAEVLAFLEPFTQAEFKKARAEGRHESRGAYMFDAMVAALRAARAGGRSEGVTAPVRIIARVDAAAVHRGHTDAGEVCEIEGLGPVPVDALREAPLPQAAIDVIVSDGQDVFNVTSFSRRPNIRQQVVLHWLGVECARLGCGATRNLQIDHRLDWAKTHVTGFRALEWLCTCDHRRKTIDDWSLVEGRGKRRMVPPDDPEHPKNRPKDVAA